MYFHKEIFKEHFGKPYRWSIGGILILDLFCVFLILAFILISIQPPAFMAIVVVGIPLFSILIFLPALISYYWRALKQSERQRQWIENGEIHVLLVPDNGFVWGTGKVHHTKEYIIHRVEWIRVTNTHFIVAGEITLIDNYNNCIETISVAKCKIPRNFTNEEEILQFGGEV